jgi:hypothetical protein
MAKRPDWSRRLPKPLTIMDEQQVGKRIVRSKLLTLEALADVRAFMRHLPKERLAFDTWRTVSRHMDEAAAGGDIELCAVSLRMVLTLKRVGVR